MGRNDSNSSLPYKVVTSEELGRYLIASRDISPGEVVLTERPIVFGPKSMPDPEAQMPCVGCYKPIFTDIGERCAKCGWPVCSGNCPGLSDPRHHSVECNILRVRPECVLDDMADYYRHDALLPLRTILLQNIEPEKWKKVLELQSNMDSRSPGTDVYEETNEFLVEYLLENFISKLDKETKDKYLPEISKRLIHSICGIIDTNALEVRLPDGAELQALYAETSIMEHSCVPNTKHTFNHSSKDKDELYSVTVKVVIPVMKDEHISTMYSHALWGTQARRQHLKDTKYFACKCPRCSDPSELGTYISAMKCFGDGTKPCNGIHLPEDPLDEETDWACSECPVKVNNSQINMLISQMGEEVDNVLMMGGSLSTLENVLCRLSTFLHPNHYHLYSLKHSLVQLYGRQSNYMSDEILDKKIKMCKDLIKITETLDPGNARLSLYSSVLQHELHSALVIKAKKMKSDGTIKTVEEMKPLITEAKLCIQRALEVLKDDMEETSGRKLYTVIQESKNAFDMYWKQNNLSV